MRKFLAIVAVVSCSVVGMWSALLLALFSNGCDRDERVIAVDGQGRSVLATWEACTTVGTVTYGEVDLVSRWGRRQTIFAYVPFGGAAPASVSVEGPYEPEAKWTAPGELLITIGTVASVVEQQSAVDGVRVRYDIGTVVTASPPPVAGAASPPPR